MDHRNDVSDIDEENRGFARTVGTLVPGSPWRYLPALENGAAVASKTTAIVTFM